MTVNLSTPTSASLLGAPDQVAIDTPANIESFEAFEYRNSSTTCDAGSGYFVVTHCWERVRMKRWMSESTRTTLGPVVFFLRAVRKETR